MLLWKWFSRQIYWYDFHISTLNNLKVIHHLFSQYLTQILSKTTSFTEPEEVTIKYPSSQISRHFEFFNIFLLFFT
jgi:hypothetical protein